MAEKRKLPPGVSEAFRELMENPVSFFPAIARVCGSAAAGLMLCQAIYWSGEKSVIARGGWFWKTAAEWEEETCLSSREQRTARETILKKGFWEEEKHKINGAPTLHFRVDFSAITDAHISKVEAKMESAETTNQATNGKCGNDKSIENDEPQNQAPDLSKKENDEPQNLYIQRLHTETTRDYTEKTGEPDPSHAGSHNGSQSHASNIGYLATLEALKQSTAKQRDLYQPERLLLDTSAAEDFNSIEVAIAICGELGLVGDKSRLLMDKALVVYRVRHQGKDWKTCGEELLGFWREYQHTVTGKYKRGFTSFFEDGLFLPDKRKEWAKGPQPVGAASANNFLDERRRQLGDKAHE